MAIMPFLEAERDERLVADLQSAYAKEKEVMKHDPHWVGQEAASKETKRWTVPEQYLNYFRHK
jgi:hypothetical protein